MVHGIGSRGKQPCCVICYDSMVANNKQNDDEIIIVKTRCRHVFHNHCIQQWLMHSNNCPECRSPVSRSDLEKLFINFCTEKSDNNKAEEWDALNDRLCAKDLECKEKDKKILAKDVECMEKENKIAGLLLNQSRSELEIREKDKQIAGLLVDRCIFESRIEEKDNKIGELQNSLVRDCAEKNNIIIGLGIDYAVCEKKIEERDKKIEERDRIIEKRDMKIQQLEILFPQLIKEIHLIKEAVQKLGTNYAQLKQESSEESKKLINILQEKNTLVEKLEFMNNNAKEIVDRCPLVMANDAKNISANMKVPVSQENRTNFMNILTKLKQLPDSGIDRTKAKHGFKLVKQTESLQSDSEKIIGQPQERHKDSNSSSPSLSGSPINLPVMSSSSIIQDFSSGNKRQKVSSSNYVEKYRLVPIEFENTVLPSKRKF